MFFDTLAFLLLMIAIFTIWLFPKKRWVHILWLALSLTTAIFQGRVDVMGIPFFILLGLLFYFGEKSTKRPLQIISYLGFVVCLVLYYLYRPLPFFHPLPIFDQVRFSGDSSPYSLTFHFDLSFTAAIILSILGWGHPTGRPRPFFKTVTICLALCVGTLLLTGMGVGYVRFDPKLPKELMPWAFHNFFLTCVAEETIFRRCFQYKLVSILSFSKIGNVLALVLAALIFGLAHYKGGAVYMALAGIAGLFYGYAYQQTKRLEAPILVHFSLNLIHFIFFSYPALQH